MLRRAESVEISHRAFWLTSRGRIVLIIGSTAHELPEKISSREFKRKIDCAETFPQAFPVEDKGRTYWLFGKAWYWDNEGLSAEQVHALLMTKQHRREAEIERAQAVIAMTHAPPASKRGSIPDDVRQVVWLRDGGCCQTCGTNVELQFDHIIPIHMGGASTVENLQVLCGPCNRRKGGGLS